MAASKVAWESYKITFCAKEIATLAGWIRLGQSGSLIGLPGSGKSNLLSFLSHRPDAVAHYLQDCPFQAALVHVDLNNLPGDDLATFYRVILRSLYEADVHLKAIEGSLFENIQSLYHRVEEKTDPFVSQSALREALFAFRARGARLVLVMDPFDQFGRTAPTLLLDNLRGLRDGFKSTLTYIIGLRHELAYIRDPVELGELYELLDAHLCWVRILTQEDARYSISQVEEAAAKSFDEKHVERLIELSGSYPALLRAASLWLAETIPVPDISTWEDELLAVPSIQNRLNDIWQALTGEEQTALSVLQVALGIGSQKERRESLRQMEEKYERVLAGLQTKQMCARTESGWQFFSPLFAWFVARQEGIRAGRVWYDAQTNRFLHGDTELAELSEQDRRLLRHFLDHPLDRHTIDGLIESVWAEYASEGVTTWAVQQAIRHLRKQIELNPAKPSYLVTVHGAGYRFFPEGAPGG